MLKIDDTELAELHALAAAEDAPIAVMVRKWLAERYSARFGDVVPPATKTKFGAVIRPSAKR